MSSRDSVFISYSHKDKQYLDALKTMLAPIQRNHNVSIWEDTQISPGALWRDEINDALNSAKVAVFLVSDNFLASNFIVEHELHPLLQAATNDGVVILWVLIRECMWETIKELEERQAVHPLTTPLERLSEPEQRTIFKELGRKVLENLNATPSLHKDGTLKTTGHLPLHNLPLDSLGDLFKGREDALATLHASLTQNKTTAVVQKQAIHGLGGIGKTRLAVEYAYRYAREYTALLFVRADAPAAVHASLAALADLLHLPERDAREEPVKTAAVLHWLETNTGWLLILDNVDAEAAAAAVLPLLPRLNNGCVLITTRRAHWSPSVNRHELDILAIEDAAAYLLERTDHDRTKSPEDQLRAEELAKNLGGLPLALELAAAYINSRHWSFERYLELWETERKSILEWHDKLQTEYPFSLAFTWQASFDQLTPQARVLLNICAFLAPNPIPEFLFEGQEDHLQEALDGVQGTGKKKKKSSPQIPFNVTEALAGLYTYSLITPEENNAFSIHRLVQEVVRSRLPNDSHPKWIQIALTLVDTATPFETFDVRTWPVMNQLHPHALTITAQADTLGISEPTARLMGGLGNYLLAKALYVEAEPLMRRALKIMDTSFGQEHPDVAAYLNNLAQLLQATNRLEEAEPLMKRALEIDENSFGPDHPDVARDLNNLAGLLWNTNRLAEAEPLMRRALEIWENPLGPEHPIVATCLNNLAQLLQATNRLTDAEPLMRRALEIDENSLGPDHPDVARDLNNLAQLLQATNRLEEAEPLMKRALEIDENSFGPDHPDVARDLNNLAQLLQATNRLLEAEPLMRRALDIDEKSFGPDHPSVARDLNNLAQLLQATNRLAEAERLMKRALDIDEKSFGLDHPDVARDLNNLAQLLQATNRLTEAEPLMRRALDIDENSFGPDHPNVARDLNNLAQLLQDTHRLAEAEPLMRRALKIWENSLGPEHPNVASCLNNLAQLFQDTHRLADAEPLMRRAMQIFEASLGPDHPNTCTARENLELLEAEIARESL